MPLSQVDHPIILGIVGDSAAGKTTLSRGIADIFGRDKVAIICTDDYHKYDRKRRAELGVSALDPKANYINIMEQHLRLLRDGQPILKPIYNHHGGTLDAPDYVEPRPCIIVEGLLGYSTRKLRECYDVKIFLDPVEQLRVKWKISRDTSKRGYTKEQVLEQLRKREYDSKHYIQPQRTYADMVVQFYPPCEHTEETGAHLNVRHVLRPTLPHPDLTPILDQPGTRGVHLDLTRGPDRKPVDVLRIDGDITDEHAEEVEDLLWTLIPEASHLRAKLGKFSVGDNGKAQSHPLSLTQLLIAYHMVKAALGVHAI